MFSDFFVRLNIPIPNNGNEIVYDQQEVNNIPPIFAWGIMGHTHQWGTGYTTYLRNQDGSRGELIYDASCPGGVPGCAQPFYDYQHIPIRYFDSLYELPMNPGFIHEAKWINNGPVPVNFGPTSDDEMMALVIMYTESLDGIMTNSSEPEILEKEQIKIYPNPMQEEVTVIFPSSMENVNFMLYNTSGQEVRRVENITDFNFTFSRGKLPSGLYFFQIKNKEGKFKTGKVLID